MARNTENPPHRQSRPDRVRRTWLSEVTQRVKRALGMQGFLCDSCRYDWRSACHRPERPNATRCPDYRSRGGQ